MHTSPRTVALIGAGPVGLDLAYRLQKRKISYYHFDGGPVGNTLLDLSPATAIGKGPEIQIADQPLAGSESYYRDDYLTYLRAVARERQLDVHTFEQVCGIHCLGPQWHLRTAGYNQVCHQYRVRYLIFATGNRNLRRACFFPGSDNPIVHSRLRHPHHYFQRTVLVLGAGPEAQEAVRRCAGIARRVYLCSAGTELQPTPTQPDLHREVVQLIQRNEVTYWSGCQVERLDGSQVLLRRSYGGRHTLEVDFLLAQAGCEPDYNLLNRVGVSLKGPHMAPVHDPETMETNVGKVYVAGAIAQGTAPDSRAIPLGRKHAQRITADLEEQISIRPLATPPRDTRLPVPSLWSRWSPEITSGGASSPVIP